MNKLSIGLTVLLALLLSGCATSTPKPESVDVLKKQCATSHATACTKLGTYYWYGKGVKRDYSKMREYWDKGCRLNDGLGCAKLGALYQDGGKGVKRNYQKAKQYYTKACNLKDVIGCTNLGALYATGKGVKVNYTKAKKYFKKACDMNFGAGCSALAGSHVLSSKSDSKSKVFIYANKGCKLNDGGGCTVLGTAYQFGIGVKENISMAKKYYYKACKLGNSRGCSYYKKLKSKGY